MAVAVQPNRVKKQYRSRYEVTEDAMASLSLSTTSQKYRVVHSNFAPLVDEIQHDVGGFARKAFTVNLISSQNRDDADNTMIPPATRASTVLGIILGKIQYNEACFDTFVSILRDMPVLSHLADHLTRAVRQTPNPNLVLGLSPSTESTQTLSSQNTSSTFDSPTISSRVNTRSTSSTGSILSPDSSDLAQSPLTPYSDQTDSSSMGEQRNRTGFRCPCGQCTLDTYLGGGCPEMESSLQSKKFPYVNMDHLDNASKIDLQAKLTSDTKKIVNHFADLIRSTLTSLKRQNIPPKDLAICVLSLRAMDSDAFSKPLLKEHEVKLMSAESVSDVILTLMPYISFFNYEILSRIIKDLGTEDDQRKLEEYLSSFNRFCKRSVFEVPPSVYGLAPSNPEKRKLFAVKLTKATHQSTLENVIIHQQKIAEILDLSPSCLYLCRVDKGCVELSFLIPTFVATERFPLHSSRLTKFQENGFKLLVDPSNYQKPPPLELTNNEVMNLKRTVLLDELEYICEELVDPSRYLPYLRSRGVLDVTDCEVIQSLVTTLEKTDKLVTLLQNRVDSNGQHSFDVFVTALRKQRVQAHIAGRLQRTLNKKKEEAKRMKESCQDMAQFARLPEVQVSQDEQMSHSSSDASPAPISRPSSDVSLSSQPFQIHPEHGPLPPAPPPHDHTSTPHPQDDDTYHPEFGVLPPQPPQFITSGVGPQSQVSAASSNSSGMLPPQPPQFITSGVGSQSQVSAASSNSSGIGTQISAISGSVVSQVSVSSEDSIDAGPQGEPVGFHSSHKKEQHKTISVSPVDTHGGEDTMRSLKFQSSDSKIKDLEGQVQSLSKEIAMLKDRLRESQKHNRILSKKLEASDQKLKETQDDNAYLRGKLKIYEYRAKSPQRLTMKHSLSPISPSKGLLQFSKDASPVDEHGMKNIDTYTTSLV